MSNLLELEHVTKHYKQGGDKVEILKDINLSVKKGELISIIGASGSGKSTLMHLIGLLDSATSGSIMIDGVDANKLNDAKKTNLRLKYLGFIYQHHYLLSDFNARENIALASILSGTSRSKALEEADQWLERLNMAHRKLSLPSQLSGGEQQRLSIARALVNKPSLILADEPTGNLDPKNAMEVFNLFLEIVRANNISAIIVTHNHDLAAKSDKIYKLIDGQLN